MSTARRRTGFLLIVLLSLSSMAVSQGSAETEITPLETSGINGSRIIHVSASELTRHLAKSVPPDYPSASAENQVQGKVTLLIGIAPDGSVLYLRGTEGHPLLIRAALDAVQQWRFEPFFVEGRPVEVQSSVHILFSLGPQVKLQQTCWTQEIECLDLLRGKRFDEAAESCNTALQNAKKLKGEAFGLRRDAYGYAALAAYHLNRLPESVEGFEERLKLAKEELPPDSLEWYDVYHDLALAHQARGDLGLAEDDYREAEGWLGSEKNRAKLQQIRTEHATLLRQMGRNSEADDLEQRAKSSPAK